MSYTSEVLLDNPAGYWAMIEASGTVATDTSPTALNGTYVNSPALASVVTPVVGLNPVASFSRAASQCVIWADQAAHDLGDTFTLEAWIRPNAIAPGTVRTIVGKGLDSFVLDIDGSGFIRLRKSGGATIISSTVPIPDLGWHMVQAWKNGSAGAGIDLDASPVSGVFTNQTIVANAIGLNVGADNGANFFDGAIARVALYAAVVNDDRRAVHWGRHWGTNGIAATPTPNIPSDRPSLSFSVRTKYVGEAIQLTLSQAGTNRYELRDLDYNLVQSGAVTGTTVPFGTNLNPGWYRVFLYGPNWDPTYKYSYGAATIQVLRNKPGFINRTLVSSAGTGGEVRDSATKGFFGMGTSRQLISFAFDPTGATNPTADTIAVCQADAPRAQAHHPSDPARPIQQWTNFVNAQEPSWDTYDNPPPGNFLAFRCYVKTGDIPGQNVFIEVVNGTTSGKKVNIYYPNNTTLVASHDNCADGAAMAAAVNAGAANTIVYATSYTGTLVNSAKTAIGNAYRAGTIQTVQALYPAPYNITHFEGPHNEPEPLQANWAHEAKLFAHAVHTGHPDAKAIGPTTVGVHDLTGWTSFLNAGGGDAYDHIAVHGYNDPAALNPWKKLLADHGLADKPIWQTEANNVATSVFNIAHHRRSKEIMQKTELWEQIGVPAHRNTPWYDVSHSFWPVATFAESTEHYQAYMVMLRVRAEELWGRLWHHPIDFASVQANQIFLGNVYKHITDGTTTAVMICHSYMPNSTVTINVHGTSGPLTLCDTFGNETTVTITAGKATITVPDIPVYLQFPAGSHMSVDSVRDWGSSPPPSISAAAGTKKIRTTVDDSVANSGLMVKRSTFEGLAVSFFPLPETAEANNFSGLVNVDRVIVHTGPVYQGQAAIYDFDIQTTVDGTIWTTRKTVTAETPTSIVHPSSPNGLGTYIETFWKEQSIHDVKLDATYSVLGVRIYVRGASAGGEPDARSDWTGGQGSRDKLGFSRPYLTVEEICIPSASTPSSAVGVPVNTVAPKIVGFPLVGDQITAPVVSWSNTPGWSNNPTRYAYQWQTCDDLAGTNPVDIVGATRADKILTPGSDTVSSYFVQEEDGLSKWIVEEGGGFWRTEESA